MDLDALVNLTGIAFAASWTPGPNTVMLASSGATFGWRRTLPHAFGITLGFPVMLMIVALGFGQIFLVVPILATVMAWIGFGVMIWLAWRIARARPGGGGQRASRPLSFLQASAFQWVNPKAWAMAIGVGGAFITADAPLRQALIAGAVFMFAGLSATQGWALFGTAIGRFLGQGNRLAIFNAAMGLLLAACAVWMLLSR
ncbi:MAG: LysE family translocator [Pseudomonadota bacterium]